MPRRRTVSIAVGVVAAVWVALLTAVLGAWHGLNRHPPTVLASPAVQMLWDAPPFAFVDQDGRRVTNATLRGRPYVADFIFTTCTTACPTLTAKLDLLRRRVASPAARFVSFSVDPDHDTPAVLKAYAAQWGDRPDPRWTLLSTDPAGLAAVAKGFKVAVEPSGDPASPISHTTLFLLVDADGTVRGAYDSTDDAQLDKLAGDLTALAGGESPTAPVAATGDGPVARGQRVYAAMSCAACHAQPRLAPPLASLANSMVRLSDGSTVWADDAYLHESIANPSAKIVAGYLNAMPSYRGSLSDEQTADLVAYIKSLSGNPPGGHGLAMTAKRGPPPELLTDVDPVCRMTVAVNPAGPAVTAGGRTYHFCSDRCRERFAADPNRYLPRANLPTSGPSGNP